MVTPAIDYDVKDLALAEKGRARIEWADQEMRVLGQIAGDEVMAIFVPGLAGAHFARQAVEAAEALLTSIGYGTTAGSWLEVGIGISTGEEYVGNVGGGGFKDFTAIGDVTNTAARLQASAKGGDILMCDVTYEALAGTHPAAEAGTMQLKGKRITVETHRIRID